MINEHTLKNSFRAIKADILQIHGELMSIKQEQARILVDLEIMKSKKKTVKKKPKTKTKIVTKTVTKRPKRLYIASKEGKKFHMEKCPYAQNIKPKSKLKFNSTVTPLNQGFKPCNCVK